MLLRDEPTGGALDTVMLRLGSVLHQWEQAKVDDDLRADCAKFDSLIAPILTRLSSHTTVAALAEYLWFEARDHLAIDPKRARPDLLAERLVAWYGDETTQDQGHLREPLCAVALDAVRWISPPQDTV